VSTIRIEQGDWMKNASILGFLRILESKMKNIDDIKIEVDYIEFDSELLNNFEEDYFEVLINNNEKNISWYKIISYENIIDNFEIENMTEKDLKKFNTIVEYVKNKVKSNSYKSGYILLKDSGFILESEKKLKIIKLKKNESLINYKKEFLENKELLQNIINYMKKPEVKKIIAAKNVMYEIIQSFWTNVSFLNKTKNKENMYDLYRDDFILPVFNYNDKNKEKAKYNCFTCDNKILKLGKPEAFDITWLIKTGVDMTRKSSHFWNMNGDAHICPICNLVYSCLPLGFTFLKGRGLFINNNQSIRKLKQSNIITNDYNKSIEEIEQMSYFNILNYMEQESIENIDKEFENIQVVKIDSNNITRPYSFNILSKRMMKIVFYHRKKLDSLVNVRIKIADKYYINLYNEVIRNIYDGKNLFELISKLFVLNKDSRYIYKILEINNSIVGGVNMRNEDLAKFRSYGLELRKVYKEKDSEVKIQGITYKLLNSLRTKDTNRFMDTIINSYMYIKHEIPGDFVNAMNNENSLQSGGYAFLVGIQGAKENKKNEGEVKGNE